MKTRESIFVNAPAAALWSLIADPNRWPDWQKKALSVKRSRTGIVIPSEEFFITFQLKTRQTETRIHVQKVVPHESLELRQHFDHHIRTRSSDIFFQIKPEKNGVLVTQTLDHKNAIPWFFRLLISILQQLGRPASSSALKTLKKVAEGATPASTSLTK